MSTIYLDVENESNKITINVGDNVFFFFFSNIVL
jgi:hypothetical protein